MDSHPGGRDILQIAAGRDCSILFKQYHGEPIYQSLPKYEIGVLTDVELVDFPRESQSPFYSTLKRVRTTRVTFFVFFSSACFSTNSVDRSHSSRLNSHALLFVLVVCCLFGHVDVGAL
jgi:hypothetical protein